MTNRLPEIEGYLQKIRELYALIDAIQDECPHDWQPSIPEHLGASSPRCINCGLTKTGWWCEASPTKECVYTRTYDICDYCGNPEERK